MASLMDRLRRFLELTWGVSDYIELDDAELEVLLYEFKAGINAYLAGTASNVKPRTLAELIAFNEQHKDREMPSFGQELFVQAEAKGPLTTRTLSPSSNTIVTDEMPNFDTLRSSLIRGRPPIADSTG